MTIKFGDFKNTRVCNDTHRLYLVCNIVRSARDILYRCGVLFICVRATPNAYCQINGRLHTFCILLPVTRGAEWHYFNIMRTLFLILISCLLVSTNITYAQSSKATKKVIKANAKQFEKEGWSLDGTGTFGSVLEAHYAALDSGDAMELVGNANAKQSINIAKTIARNNAINEYVEYTRSMIRARINTDITDMNSEQRENFVAGYERLVVKELDGDMKPSFYLYRRNGDGTYEMRAFFVVDEAKAAAASKRALEAAAKELDIATSYADKVSDFVKSGLNENK